MNTKTSTGLNINNNCYDIIRIVCAFTIFLGHFLTHLNVDNSVLMEIAYFVRGVPIFFFLSGLFIARSLERYDTKIFLIHRFIRIYPELWVCVILNLIIILFSIGGYSLRDVVIYIVTQLTVFQFYTGDWLRNYGVGTPNGALWTITVDIQFYVLAIFLVKWLRDKVRLWVPIIVLTIFIDLSLEKMKGYYSEIVYKLIQCNVVPFIWIFLIGMCIYYNRETIIPNLVKLKWVFLAIYITWQYAVPVNIQELFEGVRYNVITTFLMLLTVTGIGFGYNVRLKQDYSYSFYLYHMVIINFIVHNIFKQFDNNMELILTFIGTVIVIGIFAVLSHKYVAGNLRKVIENKLLLGD